MKQYATAGTRRVALLALAACATIAFALAADPTPLEQARSAADAGKFAEAEAILRAELDDANAPVTSEPAIALEVLRRIRQDYSLTADELFEKLRQSVPDATAEDVERWTASGDLQHRVIDGEVRYFNRAVGILVRFCPEARKRQASDVPRAGSGFDLPQCLARIVAGADEADSPLVHPVRHRVRYTLRVNAGHPRLKPGAKVRCWLPFPQEYRQQQKVRLIRTEPEGGVVAPNGHPQRTIYFEQTIEDGEKPPAFRAEVEFVTYAYVPKLDAGAVKPYDRESEVYREFTAERPPHIVFTPDVRQLAAEMVQDEPNPLERARRIFRWVSHNIPWCPEMEYSTIPNLSGKGLAARRGDCGVQGLVFITLCRAAGVPARWQSGWQTMPGGWNMHDWSEFYVEPWGWLPADASYGLQRHEDVRVREFYCGHLDPYRLIVNLDYGRELHPPKISFRSEPNDFQRGEIEIDGHNLYYGEWRWDFDVETLPLEGGFAGLEEAFDAIVPGELQAGGMSGAVVVVGRKTADGFETWQKVYGYLCTEPQRVTMPPDAIFDLASMTKPIATGTCLMKLVEAGKVDLDAPVGTYLPEFAAGDKRKVTVRHLMTHTSGMPPYVGAGKQKEIRDAAGYPCPAALRKYVRDLELQHAPGERVTYSCLNAMLCAEIVAAVAGVPLDEYAAREVFGPLGLADTGFNPGVDRRARIVPTTKSDEPGGVSGYLRGRVHDPLAAMQGGVSGNAGLFSTAADVGRFAQMLLAGGELDGVRVLDEATIRMMASVQNPGVTNARGVEDRRGLLWDLYVPEPAEGEAAASSGAADRAAAGGGNPSRMAAGGHLTRGDPDFAYGHTGYTGTAIRIWPARGVYAIVLANRVHPDDSGKVGALRRRAWQAVEELLK